MQAKRLVTTSLGAIFLVLGVAAQQNNVIEVPFQGNTYVTQAGGANPYATATQIIDTWKGTILQWDDPQTVLSVFFKVGKTGKLHLSATCATGEGTDQSTLLFDALGRQHKVHVSGTEPKNYDIGTFRVKEPGYIRVDIRGLEKTGDGNFANITGFTLSGAATEGENHFIPSDKLENSYWYRRGPSVNISYALPKEDVEWFYCEILVPEGNDVDGTYFMLTGFREGYMGIQSTTREDGTPHRNVLFSVWSPYTTDDPKSIPQEDRVQTLRKGQNVRVQDFGGEGSGGQSYMIYPWETGKVYKTLVHVVPDGKGNTIYTGYFCNEKGEWMLMASFLRPKTDTYYKGAHSFLECFKPESSFATRKVVLLNQWAYTKAGEWKEVTEGSVFCDDTGASGVRIDFEGGVEDGHFFMRNGGFFNATTVPGTKFTRPASGKQPVIDFEALEKL